MKFCVIFTDVYKSQVIAIRDLRTAGSNTSCNSSSGVDSVDLSCIETGLYSTRYTACDTTGTFDRAADITGIATAFDHRGRSADISCDTTYTIGV